MNRLQQLRVVAKHYLENTSMDHDKVQDIIELINSQSQRIQELTKQNQKLQKKLKDGE